MTDLTYLSIIGAARTWFKAMDFQFRVTGEEHIPAESGAVLAINHISYVDFIMAGLGPRSVNRLTRFMAKRETFDHPVTGPPLCATASTSASTGPTSRRSYDEAVDSCAAASWSGCSPRRRSRGLLVKELKTGAVRMAEDADVPLIPLILWGTQRIMTKDHPRDFSRHKTITITIGEPFRPEGADAVEKTKVLHGRGGDARQGDQRPRRRAAPRLLVAAGVLRRLGPDARAWRRSWSGGEVERRRPEAPRKAEATRAKKK